MFWELTTVSIRWKVGGKSESCTWGDGKCSIGQQATIFTIDLLKHVRFFPLEMRLQLNSCGPAKVGVFCLVKRSIIENKTH